MAKFVAECLSSNGMFPRIALQGAVGEIHFTDEEEILEEQSGCAAVVAVATPYANRSRKYRTELDKALYTFYQPVIVFHQGKSRLLLMLTGGGVFRLDFQRGRHRSKCGRLSQAIRKEIRFARAPRDVIGGQPVPRRTVTRAR